MKGHDHPLDEKLHDEEGCPMCIEIVARKEAAKRDAGRDALAHHYAALADRKKR